MCFVLRHLSTIVANCIYALFVVKSTSGLPNWGAGGQANIDNAKILTEPILEIHPQSPEIGWGELLVLISAICFTFSRNRFGT